METLVRSFLDTAPDISEMPDVMIHECPVALDKKTGRPDTLSPELARVFNAVARYFSLLSDPTRLKILHFACREPRSVSEIVQATQATQTNVSRHLALLHQAGLMHRQRDGKHVLYWTRDPEFVKTCCHACAHMVHRIESDGTLQENWLERLNAD
ncbi:MAG: metalloregulator ArsR/SmtB family transcription factor [Proteobacteria bacterium]|nr:metalloregulator ArsR/SmtB family transcription factor [Pseudomonadota bacterium]